MLELGTLVDIYLLKSLSEILHLFILLGPLYWVQFSVNLRVYTYQRLRS